VQGTYTSQIIAVEEPLHRLPVSSRNDFPGSSSLPRVEALLLPHVSPGEKAERKAQKKEKRRRRRLRRQAQEKSEEEAMEAGVSTGPGFAGAVIGGGSVSGDVMVKGSTFARKFSEKRILETKLFNISAKSLLEGQPKTTSKPVHDKPHHHHQHHHHKHQHQQGPGNLIVVSSMPFSQSMRMKELLNEETTSAALRGGPAKRTDR